MSTAELQQMPRAEKLKLMEALWADLSSDEGALESPAWHAGELKETGERFAAGREEVIGWADAKRQLRKSLE